MVGEKEKFTIPLVIILFFQIYDVDWKEDGVGGLVEREETSYVILRYKTRD